jgi:[protein-PII] uridylyltransferase
LEHHAGILDDYFRESFERSEVGPMMGINKNPYAIFENQKEGKKL